MSPFPPARSGIADYGAFLVDGFASDSRVEHVTVLADRAVGAARHERRGAVDILRVWGRDRADNGVRLMRAIHEVDAEVVWFNLGLTIFGTGMLGAASGFASVLGARLIARHTVVTLHELPGLSDLAALGFDRARAAAACAAVPLLLRAADVVVTLEHYKEHLTNRYGARNVTHIPHGLWQRPDPPARDDGEMVLVFGMFGPHKDPSLVARAVTLVRRSRPDVRLVVAGGDHPRYPGFIAARRSAHELNGEWIGYVPAESVAALFGRAAVVVIPATASSGSSGVIHRAVGHGRALVVSDLPDFRALSREVDLRFDWFAPGDVSALAASLERLLRDPGRRRAMASHNLQSVARLGPMQTVDAYLALFERRRRRIPAQDRALTAGPRLEPRIEA